MLPLIFPFSAKRKTLAHVPVIIKGHRKVRQWVLPLYRFGEGVIWCFICDKDPLQSKNEHSARNKTARWQWLHPGEPDPGPTWGDPGWAAPSSSAPPGAASPSAAQPARHHTAVTPRHTTSPVIFILTITSYKEECCVQSSDGGCSWTDLRVYNENMNQLIRGQPVAALLLLVWHYSVYINSIIYISRGDVTLPAAWKQSWGDVLPLFVRVRLM